MSRVLHAQRALTAMLAVVWLVVGSGEVLVGLLLVGKAPRSLLVVGILHVAGAAYLDWWSRAPWGLR